MDKADAAIAARLPSANSIPQPYYAGLSAAGHVVALPCEAHLRA